MGFLFRQESPCARFPTCLWHPLEPLSLAPSLYSSCLIQSHCSEVNLDGRGKASCISPVTAVPNLDPPFSHPISATNGYPAGSTSFILSKGLHVCSLWECSHTFNSWLFKFLIQHRLFFMFRELGRSRLWWHWGIQGCWFVTHIEEDNSERKAFKHILSRMQSVPWALFLRTFGSGLQDTISTFPLEIGK